MIKGFKLFLIFTLSSLWSAEISLGIDAFLEPNNLKRYSKKRIGVITNHTAISPKGEYTIDRLLKTDLKIKALFAPEHGFYGNFQAAEKFGKDTYKKTPIYSLHGKTRRPTKAMLKDIDVLIFDIQDIGVRPYTYTSTLFYCMEEAKKHKIEMIVLDRPNPMGGISFDGPMLEEKFRSFIGYVNVPYCHGMTVCELAALFNKEYKIGCALSLFKMKGWKREYTFTDLNLLWVPTSPNIPEKDTPFYCATTGFIGELPLVNIGIGTSFPFKVVVAPWIDAQKFATSLNRQNLKGVLFTPFYLTPQLGSMKNKLCGGVKIHITDTKTYKPNKTGQIILGILKSLYPTHVNKALAGLKKIHIDLFTKATGSDKFLSLLKEETFPAYKLIEQSYKNQEQHTAVRDKYLLYP